MRVGGSLAHVARRVAGARNVPSTVRCLASSSTVTASSSSEAAAAAVTAAPPPPPAAPSSSEEVIELEEHYSAHNYHPIPAVYAKAKGMHVWDPEGRRYLDFLSAYSAVNQGHCHPKILSALHEQAEYVTLSSRAFYNSRFPPMAKYLTELCGYDMLLPMNSGAEAVETALKLARKWGYLTKRIPQDQALIVSCCNCFHGRTLGAIAMSCDPEATADFGPPVPGMLKVDFGDSAALARVFEEHGHRIAAFLFEPIQGEAGVIVPPEGYLRDVRRLCTQYNILMVADEIQTGIARTGKMLAVEHEDVRPDVLILGKALSGGVLPVSAVLADAPVMSLFQPNQHGSTFGGNPLASAVTVAAMQVVVEERLAERAQDLGVEFRQMLAGVQQAAPELVKLVRGKGLLNALVMDKENSARMGVQAWDVCMRLKERGILAKPTHRHIIRLTPPLVISREQLQQAADALTATLTTDVPWLQKQSAQRPPAPPAQPCLRCGRVRAP